MHYIVIIPKAPGYANTPHYLKGPQTPQEVKKKGYDLTTNEAEAWRFPTQGKAQHKARILERFFSWGTGTAQTWGREGEAA